MAAIAESEAKRRLSELIDRVVAGEVIEITRRGRVVAQLGPSSVDTDSADAQRAIDDLLAARTGVSLGDLKMQDLVGKGRR